MSRRPILLAASPTAPWPTSDGLSLRVYHLLRELASSWDIALVAPAVDPVHRATMPPLPLYSYTEVPVGGEGWAATSAALDRSVGALARELRPACAIAWPGAERAWLADASLPPLVADRVDSAALTAWRDLGMQRTLRQRLSMGRHLLDVALYERRVARRASACIAVGERDVAAIRRVGGGARVCLVPNGVALPVLADLPAKSAVPTAIFSGVLGYGPNVDAAIYAARELWPRVREAVPDARLIIAGRTPVPEVTALASQPGVELRIDVPDMRAELARAWVALAPMRTGTGIKNKVLEAWACGTPAILSTLATNGLAIPPGSEGLVVDGTRDSAAAIVDLLRDAPRRERAGREARQLTERAFSWPVVAQELSRILGSVQ